MLWQQSASKTNSHDAQSAFIVSDGQGQLTTLCVYRCATTELDAVDKRERIFTDSKLHMMSFDNHLQAI